MRSTHIKMRINGREHEADVDVRMLFADFIREMTGLKGTRLGCEHGVCGACTVQLDGEAVRSCLILAVQANGAQVRTVEGLAAAPEDGLDPLREAFRCEHALQCGFCTSGFLVTLDAYIRDVRDSDLRSPERMREAIGGNLCRCTGYQPIVSAGLRAASALRSPTADSGR